MLVPILFYTTSPITDLERLDGKDIKSQEKTFVVGTTYGGGLTTQLFTGDDPGGRGKVGVG